MVKKIKNNINKSNTKHFFEVGSTNLTYLTKVTDIKDQPEIHLKTYFSDNLFQGISRLEAPLHMRIIINNQK